MQGRVKKQVVTVIAVIATAVTVVSVVIWATMQTPPTLPPFLTIYRGDSDYRYGEEDFEGGCVVIRTSAEWRAFWSKHVNLRTTKPPVPEVVFDVHMVLGCFLGWQSSGGPSIDIVRVVLAETDYVAYVDRNYTQGQTLAITNPCSIVRAPATQNQVVFLDAVTEEQIPEL